MPFGRIVGQIQAGDPQAVRRLAVRIRTLPDPSAALTGVGGFASVVSDDQGRFTVPAIAAGMLALSVDLRWDLPWRGLLPSRPPVQPGTTTEVTVPLKPAALVKGVVQEIGSGRPVAGVGVAVVMDAETPLAPSDAEGRFSAYVAPGMARSYAVGMPRGYFSPSTRVNSQPLPEGVKELTMKPLGLGRAVEVRGRVVDEEGKAVSGADVSGHYGDVVTNAGRIHAVADREGRFRIESLPPDTTLQLSASHRGATTAAPESIATSKGSVTIKISPEHAVALYGRVKDPADRPLAGAVVRVQARKRGSQDIPLEQLTIAFDDEGHTTLRTAADGQFHTPRQLRPDLEYRVEVEADDYVPAGTEWIKPGDRKLLYFPPLVLQPMTQTRTVAGRVVDVQGRPIADARRVPVGRRSRTHEHHHRPLTGRFRLRGVYREPAFLFVEGDGLAFEGHRIGSGAEPVELKVRRAGDPPGPPLHTLPSVVPVAEEKALAQRLIESDLSPLTGKEVTTDTLVLIRTLPRVDLERALELVETKAVPDPVYNEQLRLECARAMAATEPGRGGHDRRDGDGRRAPLAVLSRGQRRLAEAEPRPQARHARQGPAARPHRERPPSQAR